MTARERLRETVLWVGAVLGVLCILWTIAMFAFGLTPLVFTSGSMSPAIRAGDLAFAQTIDADEIEVGDILSVVNENGVRITHRVVRVDPTDDGAVVVLKGDANAQPDVEPYSVTSAERVLFHVPKAGYVVDAVSSPVGMFVGGLLAAAALFVAFGGGGGGSGRGSSEENASEDAPPAHVAGDDPVAKRDRRTFLIGPVVLVLGMLVAAQPAQAAFTDTATMTSGTFTAAPLPARPISMNCTDGGLGRVDMTFPNPNSPKGTPYAYVIELADNSNWTSPRTTVLQPAAGATRTFSVDGSFLGGLFTGTIYYVRIFSAYVDTGGTATWRSTDFRAWSLNRVLVTNWFTCRSNLTP